MTVPAGRGDGEIRPVAEAELPLCLSLMAQLRPHLTTPEDFLARWRRMAAMGYRLLALWDGGRPVALAGYRIQENLVHGRFLYVDDLVADRTRRGQGGGARMMDHLAVVAAAEGCARLVLDTGLDNALAQRFYFRQGLLARALRFYGEVPGPRRAEAS
ncbi:MAG: GNAT family N-acetyltransferase [Telmatospirillum sp.]|nr:GNAT family N-acetyltransferase [Telmatospirillum sp.]